MHTRPTRGVLALVVVLSFAAPSLARAQQSEALVELIRIVRPVPTGVGGRAVTDMILRLNEAATPALIEGLYPIITSGRSDAVAAAMGSLEDPQAAALLLQDPQLQMDIHRLLQELRASPNASAWNAGRLRNMLTQQTMSPVQVQYAACPPSVRGTLSALFLPLRQAFGWKPRPLTYSVNTIQWKAEGIARELYGGGRAADLVREDLSSDGRILAMAAENRVAQMLQGELAATGAPYDVIVQLEDGSTANIEVRVVGNHGVSFLSSVDRRANPQDALQALIDKTQQVDLFALVDITALSTSDYAPVYFIPSAQVRSWYGRGDITPSAAAFSSHARFQAAIDALEAQELLHPYDPMIRHRLRPD